jgi:hypothetical protein
MTSVVTTSEETGGSTGRESGSDIIYRKPIVRAS